MFKLDWVDDVITKASLTDLLKRHVRLAASQQAGSSSASGSDMPTTSAKLSGTGSFFAHFAARRHMQDAAGSNIEAEVDKYLMDNSSSLSSLNAYPHIKNLYVSLNTALLASAAVLGGRIFTPLRSNLSSEHFEMLLFLRMAKW